MPDEEPKSDEQPDASDKGGTESEREQDEEGKDQSLKEAGDFGSVALKNFKILWKDYMKKDFSLEYTLEHYFRETIEGIAHKVVKELQKQALLDPDSPYKDILSKWGTEFFNAAEYDLRDQLFQRTKRPLSEVLDMDLYGMDALEQGQKFLMSTDDDDEDEDGLKFKIRPPKPKVKLRVKPLELVKHGLHPDVFEEIQLYEQLKLSYRSELIDLKAKLKLEGGIDMEGIRKWSDITPPVLERQGMGSAELNVQMTLHPENQPFRLSLSGEVGYSNMPHPTRSGRREESVDASIGLSLELWFENRERRDQIERLLERERERDGEPRTPWRR